MTVLVFLLLGTVLVAQITLIIIVAGISHKLDWVKAVLTQRDRGR